MPRSLSVPWHIIERSGHGICSVLFVELATTYKEKYEALVARSSLEPIIKECLG